MLHLVIVSINLPITPASLLLFITEALTEEAVSFGAVSFLLGFVKQSLHSNTALCRMALSAVSVLISSGKFLNITGSSLYQIKIGCLKISLCNE